jgi:hypothetical protein
MAMRREDAMQPLSELGLIEQRLDRLRNGLRALVDEMADAAPPVGWRSPPSPDATLGLLDLAGNRRRLPSVKRSK